MQQPLRLCNPSMTRHVNHSAADWPASPEQKHKRSTWLTSYHHILKNCVTKDKHCHYFQSSQARSQRLRSKSSVMRKYVKKKLSRPRKDGNAATPAVALPGKQIFTLFKADTRPADSRNVQKLMLLQRRLSKWMPEAPGLPRVHDLTFVSLILT